MSNTQSLPLRSSDFRKQTEYLKMSFKGVKIKEE
jgi:hypothetical protein